MAKKKDKDKEEEAGPGLFRSKEMFTGTEIGIEVGSSLLMGGTVVGIGAMVKGLKLDDKKIRKGLGPIVGILGMGLNVVLNPMNPAARVAKGFAQGMVGWGAQDTVSKLILKDDPEKKAKWGLGHLGATPSNTPAAIADGNGGYNWTAALQKARDESPEAVEELIRWAEQQNGGGGNNNPAPAPSNPSSGNMAGFGSIMDNI